MTLLLKCKEEGILTEEPIRKFPLTYSNLQVVLKIYAVKHFTPYHVKLIKDIKTTYYLTDKGLEWFYEFFREKPFEYLRSMFSHLMIHAEPGFEPSEYSYFSNFRGTDGIHNIQGTKQRALITRQVGRCLRKYEFDTIKEARDTLRIWLTQYPIEEFKLYRLREQKGCTFKEELKLIIDRPIRDDPFKRRDK